MRSPTLSEKIALLNCLKRELVRKQRKLEILQQKDAEKGGTDGTNDNQLVIEGDKCSKTPAKKRLKRKLDFGTSSISTQKSSGKTLTNDSKTGDESTSKSCHAQSLSSEASSSEERSPILSIENDDKHLASVEDPETLKSESDSDFNLLEEDDPEFVSPKRRKIQEEKHENSSPGKLSEAEHLPELSCQAPSQIVDFHWFKGPAPSTNQEQEDCGYLLCTCEGGLLIYGESEGNWVKLVDWTTKKERIKSASILEVQRDKHELHVSVVFLSINSDEVPPYPEDLQCYETFLIKFSDGRVSCRNQVYRFSALRDSAFHCTIHPDDICIASSSPSHDEETSDCPADPVTFVRHVQVCAESLSKISSKELQEVPDRILHLLHVSRSSVVCGLSRNEAYLWHFKAGLLLKKFTLGVEWLDFTPCCDLIHQDKGLLVLAGRTPEDSQGLLIFLNPMTGVNVSVPLRELIPACDFEGFRLLRCGGPLQKAVFVSESNSELLDVFSTSGETVTITKALIPQDCPSGSSSDLVVKFDPKLERMSFGRGERFYVCKIGVE